MATERKTSRTIGFTPRQRALLAAEADRTGASYTDQVRKIVDEWLDRLPPPANK